MKTNDTPTNHRLFVSNFEESTTIQELADRFSPFGKINSLEIIKSKNIAFLSIETTLENISKCIGIYKSRKYKNSFLRIEHASLFYRQRLNIEKQAMETSRKNIENQVMLKLKSQAEKMKLINDDNCDDRKGWKRSRYGRAVCVMKMKRQGERRIRNFDPSRYKNGLIKFKFSDLDVDSSVCDLTWKIEGYDDDVSIDEDDDEQDVQDVIMDCADRKHVLEDQVATYEYLIEEQAKDREQVQQDQVATDKHLIGEQAKDQEQVQQDQVTNDEPLIEEQVTKQELQIEEPIEDANQDIIMDDSNQIQKESDKIQPIEIILFIHVHSFCSQTYALVLS